MVDDAALVICLDAQQLPSCEAFPQIQFLKVKKLGVPAAHSSFANPPPLSASADEGPATQNSEIVPLVAENNGGADETRTRVLLRDSSNSSILPTCKRKD